MEPINSLFWSFHIRWMNNLCRLFPYVLDAQLFTLGELWSTQLIVYNTKQPLAAAGAELWQRVASDPRQIAMLPLTWSHNASPIQGWAPRRWKAERPRRRDARRRSGPPPCSRHRLQREEWRVRRACWLAGSRWSEVPYKEDIGGPEKGKQCRRLFFFLFFFLRLLLLVNLIETADITAAASLWLQLLATYFWVAIESNGYTQLTQLQLH